MERVNQGQTQLLGATHQFLGAGWNSPLERVGDEAGQTCSHVKEKEPRKWWERQVGVRL